MLHSWVGLPHSTGVQPSRRQLSTAWSQPHCTSSIHTPSPLLHLSLVHEESVNDFQGVYILKRSEEYQNCKLQLPKADYFPRNSPDFRTVFGIMIGPFSFCEMGKMWGTNKQVNKQTNKNWNFQFPQPDYQPRHSPDFRTVFGIMIGPFSSCEIGKTWGLQNEKKPYVKWEKARKPLSNGRKWADYLSRYHVTDLISEQVSDFRFGHRKCLFWSEENHWK